MKISELKNVIREAIEEVTAELSQNISEGEVQEFRQHMLKRLRSMPKYKNASPATVNRVVDMLVAAWQGGDKRIAEMWTGWESKELKEGAQASINASVSKAEMQKLVQMAAPYKLSHKVDGASGHVVFSGDQGQLDAFVNHALESDLDVAFDDTISATGMLREHDETDLSNPEEAKEVELAKQLQDLVNKLLVMHGVGEEESEETPEGEEEVSAEEPAQKEPMAEAEETEEAPEASSEEADMEDPSENEEVQIARQIKSIADQILAMHGVSDEEPAGEEEAPESEEAPVEEPEKLTEKKQPKKTKAKAALAKKNSKKK